MSLSSPYEVAAGSLVMRKPSAFVAHLKPLYRDLKRFGRAGCELIPPEFLPVDYLTTFPSITPPAWDDVDTQGRRIYQLLDSSDPSKGLSDTAEKTLAMRADNIEKNIQDYHRQVSAVIDYLISRCSPDSQVELRADAQFSVAEIGQKHKEVLAFIISVHTHGPDRVSAAVAREFLSLRQDASLSTAAFIGLLEVHGALFHREFGYGSDPDHAGCIHADKLEKAVFFLGLEPTSHDRTIEELQDKHPNCTRREACEHVLRRDREMAALSASRAPAKVGVPGPSSVRPQGLVAADDQLLSLLG